MIPSEGDDSEQIEEDIPESENGNKCVYEESGEDKILEVLGRLKEKALGDILKTHRSYFKTYPNSMNGQDFISFLQINGELTLELALGLAQQFIDYDVLRRVNSKSISFNPGLRAFYRLRVNSLISN